MNEMIIQPNSRGVPTDMVLLFVCSKPHSQRRQQFGSRHFQRQAAPTPSQRRQQFGSRHFQRQAAGCANTIAASSAVWKSPFSKAGCGLRQHHRSVVSSLEVAIFKGRLRAAPTPSKTAPTSNMADPKQENCRKDQKASQRNQQD
jgi:hypothetical protein